VEKSHASIIVVVSGYNQEDQFLKEKLAALKTAFGAIIYSGESK